MEEENKERNDCPEGIWERAFSHTQHGGDNTKTPCQTLKMEEDSDLGRVIHPCCWSP